MELTIAGQYLLGDLYKIFLFSREIAGKTASWMSRFRTFGYSDKGKASRLKQMKHG